LDDLGDFTALAGLNNAGKSNILRSLNAFFRDQTEPDRSLDVDADYYRLDLRKKKAKRIRVSVTFELPPSFRIPRRIQHIESFLGGRRFEITKEWSRRDLIPAYYLDGDGPLNLEQRQKVNQFLQLITFRYIPNRVLPVQVIRSEHAALRDVLVRRLGRRVESAKEAFAEIKKTSEAMIRSMKRRVSEAVPELGDIRLAAPQSWAEMAFALGYRIATGDVEFEDELQGAGIQSLLMLETLHLIDLDYFQKFGWRQAAVWAVEEPEASLHASLEARVGFLLAEVASDERSRLQVFCTTHSSLVAQHATRVVRVWCEARETKGEVLRPEAALEKLANEGVSEWVHPLLYYPLQPLVLVEGKYDWMFMDNAFRLLEPNAKAKVRYLAQLEGTGGGGGVDALEKYLKKNMQALKARAVPVVVVLDWSAEGKRAEFENLARAGARVRVLVWPEGNANPNLTKSFRGIERFYSDRLINRAIENGAPIATLPDGKRVVEAREEERVKMVLSGIVEKELRKDDLEFAMPFLERVLKECGRG